jgi:putative nucleotidyltransferase with HDIG domain
MTDIDTTKAILGLVKKKVWVRDPRVKGGGYYAYRHVSPGTTEVPKIRIYSRKERVRRQVLFPTYPGEQEKEVETRVWYFDILKPRPGEKTGEVVGTRGPYMTRFGALVDAIKFLKQTHGAVSPHDIELFTEQKERAETQKRWEEWVSMYTKAYTVASILTLLPALLKKADNLKQNRTTRPDEGDLKGLIDEAVDILGKGLHDRITHPEGDVLTHTIHVLALLKMFDAPFRIRLAGLLHDIGKSETTYIHSPERIRHPDHDTIGGEKAEKLLLKHNFPPQLSRDVRWLTEHHMLLRDWNKLPAEEKSEIANHPLFEDLYYLTTADWIARFIPDIKNYLQGKGITKLTTAQESRD